MIKGVSQGGRRTRIAFSTVRTEANFANVLSVVFSEDIVTMDARYESVTAVNVRLDTGEELHFHDLFKKGTKGKDVFNADFYSEVVFRSAIRTSGSMDITPAVAHYNGAEDRILSLIQDFDAGKDFDFYFTPREVVLLDQLEPDLGYRDLTVWFTHCMEKVAIYHKYETPEPAYDASYPASGGIPALTDRSDPYLSTVDESDGYLLDAALYVRGDNGPADLPDACKDRVLALYTAYVQECREKIRKDAEAGVFSFHNISATAQYDPLESAGDEPNYWLKVSDRFLTWDSKEEFREASRKMLKSIRSPHLDNITGINNYLRYALTDPDQSYTDRSSLWVFDADGNIVETKETGH
ncbi:MAG: hypothetical protein J6Z38_01730 [Lachnospiraceae bacterium]|nr:hypothetical protein [Lachnospiraceae bacterium]